jgi:hypothetical protein
MLDAASSSVNAASVPTPTSSPITASATPGAVVGVAAQPAATPPDPVVQERVDQTVAATEHLGDPAYVIQETMSDPTLTQAQKDEYIAHLVDLSQAQVCTVDGSAERVAEKIQQAFEDIGVAYTGPATPELRQQVTDAIARNVDSGRLGADEIYKLVEPTNGTSDGARQLLTGITDGAVLNNVASRLLSDAERMGYDINKSQHGPETLVAAADVANMAAEHGWSATANAVVQTIDRQMQSGPVAGDMTLVQAMMATTVQGGPYGASPEGRTGFEVLSTLVNSTDTSKPDVVSATDNLFSALVRSDDGVVGGIDQFGGDKGAALKELGTYFNVNAARLIDKDWGYANTGGPESGTVRDFFENVLFNEDYGLRDQTATVVTSEMTRLAGVIDTQGRASGDLSQASAAAQSFATLTGSLEEAGQQYVAAAKGDAEQRVQTIRQFTDQVTNKVAGIGGPAGDIAGGALVDAFWDSMVERAEAGAQGYVDEKSGGMIDRANDLRRAMQDTGIDPQVISDYDNRLDLYYDGPNG